MGYKSESEFYGYLIAGYWWALTTVPMLLPPETCRLMRKIKSSKVVDETKIKKN